MPERDVRLAALLGQTSTGDGLLQGVVALPISDSAITAAGSDGQVNVYRVGTSLWLQVYDAVAGAWREVELT